MRLFNRRPKHTHLPPESVLASEPDPQTPGEIRVSRTLVKSQPELTELIAGEPHLNDDRIEVKLTEKGFGTRVAIIVEGDSGLEETDLEQLLDKLAVPQKRPFQN